MLIDFIVENFRSIRSEQRLSMVAQIADKQFSDTHLIGANLRGSSKALKSAVVYGANASGKSNLINALNYMQRVVIESATIKPGHKFSLQPFMLSGDELSKPTLFEVTFIVDETRYQYGFSMDVNRIYDEWLLVYKTPKPQTWFSRKFDEQSGKYSYEFSTYFSGQKKLWEDSTRPNALFLSTAAHLNSEMLFPVFDWFARRLIIFPGGGVTPEFTIELLKDEMSRNDIKNFLVSADISIDDISTAERKGFRQTVNFTGDGKVDASSVEQNMVIPQFHHKTRNGSAVFELANESMGTQKLFSLAGPILDILKNGRILVVDELNNSLHPLLVKHLVGLFHDNGTNVGNAQLVFTTHDTSLLNTKIFRRDQIWFVEKNEDQETNLFPLSDFKPRKGEALEKGYLSGRYGALPMFY